MLQLIESIRDREALYKPEMKEGNPIMLYSLDEITEILLLME